MYVIRTTFATALLATAALGEKPAECLKTSSFTDIGGEAVVTTDADKVGPFMKDAQVTSVNICKTATQLAGIQVSWGSFDSETNELGPVTKMNAHGSLEGEGITCEVMDFAKGVTPGLIAFYQAADNTPTGLALRDSNSVAKIFGERGTKSSDPFSFTATQALLGF